MARQSVLLDTCVLINLLASDEIEPILRATGKTVFICAAVVKEGTYLRSDDLEDPSPQPVNLDELVQTGVLTLCSLKSEEEEHLFVEYAAQLSDGEAMSLAIAEVRGFLLATDDRKARRLFLAATRNPQRLLSTPQLMKGWSRAARTTKERLKLTLLRIARRARFIPSSDDGNYDWWIDACR